MKIALISTADTVKDMPLTTPPVDLVVTDSFAGAKTKAESGVSHLKFLDMIFMAFLFYFLHLPESKGASDTKRVIQTPAFIIKKNGESVASEIKCSHNITNYDIILWYRQDEGKGLKLLGYLNLNFLYPEDDVKGKISFNGDGRHQSSLSISNLKLNDSAVYFCAAGQNNYDPAYFGSGTKLTVLEKNHTVTPPTVKVYKPHLKECSGSKDDQKNKTLVCVASGFYPDHVNVTWEVNGNDVRGNSSFGMTEDPNAVRDGNDYRITSRLRVPAAFWYANHTFTCIVTFFNGTGYEKHTESIFGEAKNGWKTEQLSRIFQTAKLSYGVFIIKSSIYGVFVAFLVWKLQGSAGKQN